MPAESHNGRSGARVCMSFFNYCFPSSSFLLIYKLLFCETRNLCRAWAAGGSEHAPEERPPWAPIREHRLQEAEVFQTGGGNV